VTPVRDREYERGNIEVVDILPLRAALDGDHAINSTTLTVVVSEAVFDEAGGQVLVNDVLYTYTAYDDDAGTLTLAGTGLTAAAADDDWVNVYEPLYNAIKTTKSGRVRLLGAADNDEPISAVFAQQLLDKLSGGIRGTVGEECLLELDGETWRIIDIYGLDDPDTGPAGPKWEADDTYVLTSADITAGTATVPLSHQPIPESLVAFFGVMGQRPSNYTINYGAQTITWPLAGWEAAGDRIWVHYAYRKGTSEPLNIAIGDTWAYATGLGSSTTYAAPGFDDSAWSWGTTLMGYGGSPPPGGTSLPPLSNVWQRRPGRTYGGNLKITIPAVDDQVFIYLDGNLIYSRTTFLGTPTVITQPCAAGNHVFAVYGVDTGSGSMVVGIAIEELQ
jgi:hypothetical protein